MRDYCITKGAPLNALGDVNGKNTWKIVDIYVCVYISLYTHTHTHTHTSDSHCHTVETNTTL